MSTEVQEIEIDNLDDFGAGSASIGDPANPGGDPDVVKDLSDGESPAGNDTVDNIDNSSDDFPDLDEELDEEVNDDQVADTSKSKTEGVSKAVKSLIKKGIINPFIGEDGKEEDLNSYTESDYEELLKANFEHVEEKAREDIQKNFFSEMPEEFALAYQYLQKGGTDLKGLFKLFAENAETHDFNIDDESDSETLVRNYLTLTNFGTPEEIEDQVTEWKDLNSLNKKAEIFKPKLQEAKQKAINKKLADQALDRQKRIDAVNKFQGDVVTVLKKGELDGIKIDKRTQSTLYNGLVNLDYDSITGRKVNLMGHLLEKYQFIEPKLDLISEVLWLLQNPEDYKNKIRASANKETVAQTVRQLKTAESEKIQTASVEDDVEDKSRNSKKIFKPRSIFG